MGGHSGRRLSFYTGDWLLFLPRTGTLLHGGEVDTIGRVGAFVPCVHLGGRHALLVSIHLEDGKENVSLGQGQNSDFEANLQHQHAQCPSWMASRWCFGWSCWWETTLWFCVWKQLWPTERSKATTGEKCQAEYILSSLIVNDVVKALHFQTFKHTPITASIIPPSWEDSETRRQRTPKEK